jgi:hypothetical protein
MAHFRRLEICLNMFKTTFGILAFGLSATLIAACGSDSKSGGGADGGSDGGSSAGGGGAGGGTSTGGKSAAGGSTGSGTPSKSEQIALCKKVCTKGLDCAGQGAVIDCTQLCTDRTNDPENAPPANCDFGKFEAKLDECVNGSCGDYDACSTELDAICPRDSSSGTGGASGDGGASGTGGASDGTDCSICDKAHDCCVGVFTANGQDTASCDSFDAASCESLGSSSSVFVTQCESVITSGARANIAACK